MHILLMYDIGEKRVQKVRKVCLKYLFPIQLSVFEGELTEAQLRKLKVDIRRVIDENYDSILIFKINNPVWIKKEVVGQEKNDHGNII